jgi:hypothetical protein
MTLNEIKECPFCGSEDLTDFKKHKKCRNCSTKIGVDGMGNLWYEYTISTDRIEEDYR